MSSLATVSLSPCSAAISSSTGATILQGPHQVAQKSTTTGLSLPRTSSAKVASVTFTGALMAGFLRGSGRTGSGRGRDGVVGGWGVAQDLLDDGVGADSDLRVLPGALEHDARGPELPAPVQDGHGAGEPGEEGRLLHRGVAAAHHDDVLVAEEEAVAGRARADAAT